MRHLRLGAAKLVRDLNFNGTIVGDVYAQPLYIEGGPNGPMIIAVTESNNVYALNATTGMVIWSRTDIGPPVQNRSVRKHQSDWYHRHACCRSRVAKTFLRCVDRRNSQQAFHLFVERGHWRHKSRLAGGRECHGQLQRNNLCFPGAGRTRWTGSRERDRVRLLLRLRRVTVAIIMAGLSALISTILLTFKGGQQRQLAAEFGDTAASPAMALTCLSSPGTHLTPAVTGWVAKQLFVCKPGQS